MQSYVALRAGEACEGDALPAAKSVPETLQLVAAELVGPLIFSLLRGVSLPAQRCVARTRQRLASGRATAALS